MTHPFVPLTYSKPSEEEVCANARRFYESMDGRRSVREFAPDSVPRSVIEDLVRTGSTAPSGAHRQPWHWAAVSDASLQREIRIAAEKEEKLSYQERMPDEWRHALAPLGTDWEKPFLEIAPWLVILFREDYGLDEAGGRIRNYYVSESVGIAAGMFIAAVHQAGLVTLTHTPSPMKFLGEILKRPSNERAYLLLPVGYPAPGVTVPDLHRKPLDEVLTVHDGGAASG